MQKIFISGIFLSSYFLLSCSGPAPGQKIVDSAVTNNIPAQLSNIIQKNGALSDEDVNITVYKSVIPSVVAINTTSQERTYFSFQTVTGTGTGFFISKNGYILTNYHVVTNASKLDVILADQSTWPGKVVGSDQEKDIAVIKVDAPSAEFSVTPLGNSDNVVVGQKVLAIGSPFGLNGTLTTGIISSLKRTLPAEDGTVLKNIIQTDAAINPGNSGGPLLNSSGEIIGMNTAIFSPNGGNVGIGFAVPINDIKSVLNNIQSQL